MSQFRAVLAALLLCLVPAASAAQEDAFFSIGSLNEGLGPVPDSVDRRTPRAAVETFLRAAEGGRWSDAAHVLDLADVAAADQPVEGELLARRLHSVLERKAVFDWSTLRARPDALQIIGGSSEPQAGQPRRSLLIRQIELDPVPGAIRLNRVRAGEEADPVWVFPRETVADVPAMYARYGPTAFEARLPDALRDEGPFDLMWWEWIGLPLLVAASALLGWVIKRLLDAVRERSSSGLFRGVVRSIRAPAMIAGVTTLVLYVSQNVFVFSGRIDAFLSPAVAVGFVAATLMLIVNGVEAVLDNTIAPGADIDITEADRHDARARATTLNAAKRVLTVVVFVVGVGVVLSSADVFRGLGLSLLASAGAITVVLGFAARRVLGNIMASLQIAMNQSARVGDRVVYKGNLCYVERINMTFVQLRDWDDTRLIVPVEEFAYETFSNWSIQDPAMKRILKFKLTPHTDLAAVRDLFHRVMDEVAQDDEHGASVGDMSGAKVDVVDQDVFGLDVWAFVPCTSPNTSWAVACEVRERMIAALQEMRDGEGRSVFPEPAAAEAA